MEETKAKREPNLESLRDLLGRLEEAEEGSRELDVAVAKAFGAPHGPRDLAIPKERSIIHHPEVAADYISRPFDLTAGMEVMPDHWVWAMGNGCGRRVRCSKQPGTRVLVRRADSGACLGPSAGHRKGVGL